MSVRPQRDTLDTVGVLEWLGAHFAAPLVKLYRAINARPRPDLVIRQLEPTGGGGSEIDFNLIVQNAGTKVAWATVTARVGDTTVATHPSTVELLPQAPAMNVRVIVPRPDLGNLVKEFNNDSTLYGRELAVEVAEGKHRATRVWREHVYTPEENRDRYEIQQRVWRRGLGEPTEADAVAEQQRDLLDRYDVAQENSRRRPSRDTERT